MEGGSFMCSQNVSACVYVLIHKYTNDSLNFQMELISIHKWMCMLVCLCV